MVIINICEKCIIIVKNYTKQGGLEKWLLMVLLLVNSILFCCYITLLWICGLKQYRPIISGFLEQDSGNKRVIWVFWCGSHKLAILWSSRVWHSLSRSFRWLAEFSSLRLQLLKSLSFWLAVSWGSVSTPRSPSLIGPLKHGNSLFLSGQGDNFSDALPSFKDQLH